MAQEDSVIMARESSSTASELSRRVFLTTTGRALTGAAAFGLVGQSHAGTRHPKRGGTLRFATRSDATGLDPHRNVLYPVSIALAATSQGLLDLNQALRRLQKSDVNADLQLRLSAFREKLAMNLRKIRLHLDAVKEIAAMLSEAIQNAESDGTYTRNIGPYRNAL